MRHTLILCAAVLAGASPAGLAQTCNTADRSVALILDASGSMHARLPGGESRIVAAQRAVKGVAALVDPNARLGLRVYGAKSPAKDRNCEDSHVAVALAPASQAGPEIERAVDQVKAQGWTPIAHSLEQAAGDFPATSKDRAIVLVSDGKETCKGDPVVTAKALAAKGIVVHTIGYAVDSAARMQLEGVARATGGKYFDAPDAPELAATLKAALHACKVADVKRPAPTKPGKLRTTATAWLKAHPVVNSETGEKVGELNHTRHELALQPGIYEVKFGASSWKGIEVRAGETTTIEPGTIRVNGLVMLGWATVFDSETGAEHGRVDPNDTTVVVMPGLYNVRMKADAPVDWQHVRVDSGKTVTLESVVVKMGRSIGEDKVRVLQEGKPIQRFNPATTSVALPAGEYVVEVNGRPSPFSAPKGGEVYVVK